MRWLFFLTRPFGVGLGLFILLNLALVLEEARLSANRVWISAPLPEPWLSLFVSVLAAALLLPHALGVRQGVRLLQAGVFLGFLTLTLTDVFRYYHRILAGEIVSHALFPFSLVISAVLGAELVRVLAWGPWNVGLPRPARAFLAAVLVAGACFALMLAHIYTFGMTDYSEIAAREGRPGVAVVLGARVYPDGRLSVALRDRMDAGVELVRDGVAGSLILSGGIDPSGLSEPEAMRRYAIEHGVPPDRLLLDQAGTTTYASARNCARIARELGCDRLLVVSQYFHNARVKLIFERAGIRCLTVPARPGRRFAREAYFLFREAIAYPFYLLFRR